MISTVALLVAAALTAEPQLVDSVAAVVDTLVITRSDVELEARVFLSNRTEFGAAGLPDTLDDRLLSRAVEYAIVQELLAEYARRTFNIVVRESEVEAAYERYQKKFGDASLTEAVDASEERIRTLLRRDLVVAALLRRILPKHAVSDESVAAFLATNPGFLPAAKDRKERAKAEVKKALQEASFAALMDELKRKTSIRRVADFSKG